LPAYFSLLTFYTPLTARRGVAFFFSNSAKAVRQIYIMKGEMEHLGLDRIIAYAEKQVAGSESAEVEGHIATCERCYGVYKTMLTVEKALEGSFREAEAEAACPEDWELAAFIRGDTPDSGVKKIAGHVKGCNSCFEKTAFFYACLKAEENPVFAPDLWKHKAIRTLAVQEERVPAHDEVSLWDRFRAYLQSVKLSFSPVPVYAMIAVVIVLLILPVLHQKRKLSIVVSSEKILLRDYEVPSSFGFTGAGETREVKYMSAGSDAKTVHMSWQPIKGAEEYAFSLKEKAGGKVVYTQSAGKIPAVAIVSGLLEKNKVYTWMITGNTDNGKYFEYTGEVRVN
jgi:hypothetical protein